MEIPKKEREGNIPWNILFQQFELSLVYDMGVPCVSDSSANEEGSRTEKSIGSSG